MVCLSGLIKMKKEMIEELFYFYPEKYGYDPLSIDKVHLAGEFNEWGRNKKLLEDYKLIQDKSGKWIGLFKVPKGKGFYKFLLNGNTFCPGLKLLSYSTVSTPLWAKEAIWYQIMVDRFYNENNSCTPNLVGWDAPPDFFNNFGGNLKGIEKKIPYFKNLFGSLHNKAIYLNPIHRSLSSNHKYWPEDFETIDPQFGTEEDLKSLIDAWHREGGKIILDLVYNHTGLNHYAFLDILKNGNHSKYYNWYRKLPHLPAEKLEIPVLENYLGNKPQNMIIENNPMSEKFDPSQESFINIWDGKYRFPVTGPERFRNSTVEDILNHQPYYKLVHIYNDPNYKCWAGFFEIPELNTRNPELKEHLFKAARKWIKFGIDGFRLDVPDILNNAHEFWKEFREQVREEAVINRKNPDDIYIVGEIWTGEGEAGSFLYGDEKGKALRFDAIMNYPVRESVLNFFSGEILNKAADSVRSHGEITVSELDRNLHQNLGYISWGTDQAQFNVFSSHDTRRLRTVLKDDRKFKAALIMQFTLIGSPTIYYGDEIGMYGGKDPANRAPMQWNVYENLLRHSSEADIFNFYKKLVNLGDNSSCLVNSPLYTVMTDNENKIYSYARYLNNSDCAIVIIARDGMDNKVHLDISDLPFENITGWKNPLSGKDYINYGKNIIIQPEDMQDCFGLILLACGE